VVNKNHITNLYAEMNVAPLPIMSSPIISMMVSREHWIIALVILLVALSLFPFRKVGYLCQCYIPFKILTYMVMTLSIVVFFEFLVFESFYSVLALAVIDILWLSEYYNKLKVHWYVDGV
jgi:hypothetical protein